MAATRKRKSKAAKSKAVTELGEKDVEKAHKWSWLLFLFCLPQRSRHRRRRSHRNGSRRVVLTPYSPDVSRVPPSQLRNRPRSQLLAQQSAEALLAKRLSKAMALPKPTADERERLVQDTSFAAVLAAKNPVKRLSSTSRHSFLTRSRTSRSASPMTRTRLQAAKNNHSSSDLATAADVMPHRVETAPKQPDSTCRLNPIKQAAAIECEPPCVVSDPSVVNSATSREKETSLDANVPSNPSMRVPAASATNPMPRPQTAISEDSRLSMASSKFSLTTFPLPPSQLLPLPPMPMRRPVSESSLYPRSEVSAYSHSSLVHSIRSSIMSRPHSIYRKAVKALPRDTQYFLDILDEHMDVPPPVPLKVRPSSTRGTRTFNTSLTPAPSGPPPPLPRSSQAAVPSGLRIQTMFEEQPSPSWDVTWEDFDTILDEWDDTCSVPERPLSELTTGSDFQSKSSVTGEYLHIVERIRSQNSSPATSVSSVASASPSDMNKALPSPPISQLPDLEPDSSTEGDPWSPHSESQPATPLLRSIMRKTMAKRRSQFSSSHPPLPAPRSFSHIAHCVIEPPPRNPARTTKHQISSSLGSSAGPLLSESTRASHPRGTDGRRIVSCAPSSTTGGGFHAACARPFDGVSFYDASSRTPSPTASIIPGLEGGYF